MSIEGQGHFFTIYFQVLHVLCFTWPRNQVSVYRTIGSLVFSFVEKEIPVQSGQLYKNPDSHSRKVHEQALTGMFG